MNQPQPKQKSADDLSEVAKIVTAKKGTKAFGEQENLLSTTSRAGAGGVIPGLVGLRPHGLKQASQLVDYYTPGKLAKKDRPFEKPIEEPKNAPYIDPSISNCVRMQLPRSFCCDCGRADRPHEGGVVNLNGYPGDRPDLNLKAMELIADVICQECAEKFRAANSDSASIIMLPMATIREQRKAWQEKRGTRCVANREAFIRANKHNSWIYLNGKPD